MPGIVAHMVVAKLVGERLKLDNDEFLKGNVLPDFLNKGSNTTHHKIQGKIYLVPDLNYWSKRLDLSDKKQLGYFTHLLLDWHFLEEYVPIKVKNKNAFIDKTMYHDYDLLNGKLVRRFSIDTNRIKQALSNPTDDINKPKLLYNLTCLDMNEEGETENLDEEDFSTFLFDISQKISEEVLAYASKSSQLPICTGQREKRKYKEK